ncbi:hypothetical protein ACPOL_2673 [Acidisarcina polymorpha]|uniref:Uncharacterized protein n=1 Tax=Acidisarcina polymorpha TaxID=2211140 RepID=A0A2Z5G074_9BACT|nr:hypothetical protein ACPOL_2673 [Acidisarcina polymorpha]
MIWLDDPNEDGEELPSVPHKLTAEMDVGPSPQVDFPEVLAGKLVGTPAVILDQLKFRNIIAVYFSGRRYKFRQINNDGTFEMHRDW